MSETVSVDGGAFRVEQVDAVARRGARVALEVSAIDAISRSRAVLELALREEGAIYGVNTGFGSLSRTRIKPDDVRAVQRNLVRSHCAGVGVPLPDDVVRAMLLLLAGSLARAKSGARPEVARTVVDVLNAGITPVVPSIGSVGASGDLAPLAHCALALIGEGEVVVNGARARAGDALRKAKITPLELESKEGLALLNGTHLMAAQGALLCADIERVFDGAFAACAMMIDACRATDAYLDERVYKARNQPGPAHVAARLRELMRGSQIVASHRADDPRVQDPYSLRCAPMVLGAAWDALQGVRAAVERELGAVTDNPLVFGAGEGGARAVVSAGAFHGMPLAIPLDVASIALTHVAGIAERRVYFLLSATDEQNPVPAYLSPHPGLHSGMMIAQYTAAACVNEMVGLSAPASVANVPTSAGMEDYNSFGPRSAAKARRALDLCALVVAIELLCAAQAIDLHRPLRSGEGVERAHKAVRSVVDTLTEDRPLTPDIEAITALVREGRFSG